uniref:Guanine deaminase n=1 Tax=Xenopus tropicalis TaxID=8364 RepID=F6THV3_XENTR
MDTVQHVFRGTFVHSTQTCPMEVLENHILGVGSTGKILFIEHAEKEAQLALKWKFDESKIEDLGKNEFFMPGMIDTHIHAPQYSFIGSGMDRPLLQWLEHITFPTEEKFSDLDLASNIYETVVRRTLKNGTTTACYFATIHTDASLVLADIADRYGQRAFIGKVCMDSNTAYPEYIESTEESIAETQRFVEAMQNMKYDRVKPIITPRFAVSCSERLLCELGRLADSYGLHIQTVMAHGCYLTDEELHLFRSNGSAISHCPNSNISLCSGHLDVSNVIKQKVKVGLGTDIAGGYSISMLDAIRKAIETSKILFMEREKRRKESKTIHNHLQEENGMLPEKECNCRIKNNGKKVLSDQEAFRLATLGGSQALNIDHITGNFEINKEFDALLISPEIHNSPFDVFSQFSKEDMVQRFLYLGDDRNIKAVYVAGRRVVPFQNNS